MVKALTSLIGLIFFGCLWLISIPCTLLVIIFDFAKENSRWLHSVVDESETEKL